MRRTISPAVFVLALATASGIIPLQASEPPPKEKLDVTVTLRLPGKTPFKEVSKILDRLDTLRVKQTFLGQPEEGKARSATVTATPQVGAKELGTVVTVLLESGIRVISLEVKDKPAK